MVYKAIIVVEREKRGREEKGTKLSTVCVFVCVLCVCGVGGVE